MSLEMLFREGLVGELTARFPDRGLRLGTPPDPIVLLPASHPELGDLTIRASDAGFNVQITIGQVCGWSQNTNRATIPRRTVIPGTA